MQIPPGLIEACIREDRKAQSRLYRLCFSFLMGVCIRYAKQESEAVALLNQGFLKILQNLERKKPNAPFEAWIRRIMINTIIDEYRRSRRYRETHQPTEFSDHSAFPESVDFNLAELKFDAQDIEALMTQLPEVSRRVFNLYAIDGYSHKEIGKMLGIADGTSKWHVAFARKKLRKLLAEQFQLSNAWMI